MTFEQLTRGLIVEVEIPKAGEPGMHWVRAVVVGFSKGRTRVHLDFEGCDWGLALTKTDVKTRVRALTITPAANHQGDIAMTTQKQIYTLDADQLAALRAFADANGRDWKSKLSHAWSTGRYRDYNGTENYGYLQQVRNTFGPSWLIKFSFDNVKTHSRKV